MADLPIIFSAPMVKALLGGRKTQTRRLAWRAWTEHRGRFNDGLDPSPWQKAKPGDRLWVRENWRAGRGYDGASVVGLPQYARVWFGADDPQQDPAVGQQLRPSIHMPRWASRLTLTLEAVRVERLREISEADALAEGPPMVGAAAFQDPRWRFMTLWNGIHGPNAWDGDPEVVALSFTVARRNIDAEARHADPA